MPSTKRKYPSYPRRTLAPAPKRRMTLKARRTTSVVSVPRPLPKTIVPNKTLVKLIFQDQFYTQVGIGSRYQDSLYNLNGLYDPRIATLGGQPSGFNQWGAFYKKYKVLKAQVQLWAFRCPTAVANYHALLYIQAGAHGAPRMSAADSSDQILETTHLNTFAICAPCPATSDTNPGFPYPHYYLKKTFDIKQVQGYMDNSTMTAAFSANPAITPWVALGCATFDSNPAVSSSEVKFDFLIRITYLTEFFELSQGVAQY